MEMRNLKLVKACIYSDAKGNYFPVAFFANPANAVYDEDQYNGTRRVRMMHNGMPCTNGCYIIPMGCCPIKGNLEMSLTNFEDILAKYECSFVCVIPCKGICSSTTEVYSAFRWMMYGKNKLSKGNDEPVSCEVKDLNNELESNNGNEETIESIKPNLRNNETYKNAFHMAIRHLADSDMIITAIRVYRYVYGGSLTEAYDAVKEICAK